MHVYCAVTLTLGGSGQIGAVVGGAAGQRVFVPSASAGPLFLLFTTKTRPAGKEPGFRLPPQVGSSVGRGNVEEGYALQGRPVGQIHRDTVALSRK